MYAYRDAMADRCQSNVRDLARRAAEDRRDFYVTGDGVKNAKAGPSKTKMITPLFGCVTVVSIS